MEMDEIQSCNKLSRIGNSRNNSNKIGRKGGEHQYQDEDDEDGEGGRKGGGGGIGGGGGTTLGVGGGGVSGGFDIIGNESNRLRAWHSSRIFRVSRASGGKDRHSKVLTAKGLRDRRVRLSVSTAIQFYDLQDRLGYDQPSKAVEWLIKAAADAISELPSLNTAFPDTPKQLSDEKRPSSALEPSRIFDPIDVEDQLDTTDPSSSYHHQQQQQQQQQQHISLSKSACSSTSETSKGSGLSLSRSEIRVKARERARERTAKDKEKEPPPPHNTQNSSSSFTELLTGGGGGGNNHSHSTQHHPGFSNFVHKQTQTQTRQMPPATSMDQYFTSGLFGQGSLRNHYSSGYSGQSLFGNHPPPHTMAAPSPYNVSGDDHDHHHHHHHHQELHQFSFLPDHMIPDATTAETGNEYNLNFSISSGIAGYNRGTLQSNSQQQQQQQQSHHPLSPQLQQRFSQTDGPNMPFFIGNVAAASAAASSPTENQYPAGFDGRLQLCYGDGGGSRHSDLKGKGKN